MLKLITAPPWRPTLWKRRQVGWLATLSCRHLGQLKPQRKLFPSKADAVAWLAAEATAHGFFYEPGAKDLSVSQALLDGRARTEKPRTGGTETGLLRFLFEGTVTAGKHRHR